MAVARGKGALANCSTRKIKRIRPGHGQEVRTSCPAPRHASDTGRRFKPARTIVPVAFILIFIDLCKTDRAQDTRRPAFSCHACHYYVRLGLASICIDCLQLGQTHELLPRERVRGSEDCPCPSAVDVQLSLLTDKKLA